MPSRPKRRQAAETEDGAHRALAQALDALGLCWCHVPNGGKRNKVEAARFSGLGVKPGVPDVLIFDAPPALEWARGAAIELKAERAAGYSLDGEQRWESSAVSPGQREWKSKLRSRLWAVALCYGLDEALAQLRGWGWGR